MRLKIAFAIIVSLLLVSCNNGVSSDDFSSETSESSSSIDQNIISFEAACDLIENQTYYSMISPIITTDSEGNKTTDNCYHIKRDRAFCFSSHTTETLSNTYYESYYDFSKEQEPIAYLRIDGIWTKMPSPITYEEALDKVIPHYGLFKKSTITEKELSYYMECSEGGWNYSFTLEVDENTITKIIEDGQNVATQETYHCEVILYFQQIGEITYPKTEEDLYSTLRYIDDAFHNLKSGRLENGNFDYNFQKKDDGLVFFRKEVRGFLTGEPDYYLDIKKDGHIYEYIYDENSDGFIRQEIETVPDDFTHFVYLINLNVMDLYMELKESIEERDLTFVTSTALLVIEYESPSVTSYERDYIQYSIRLDYNNLPYEYEEAKGHATGMQYNGYRVWDRFFKVNSITVELPN